MTEQKESGPIINFDAEPTPEEKSAILGELRRSMRRPPPPPLEALSLLYEAACGDTGGSQAARSFLFWLDGIDDPTGYRGDGGVELRRLDAKLKQAAIEVVTWWAGPTQSDDPLFHVLARLLTRFNGKAKSAEQIS
jgi:hypothetical protein